MGASTWHYFAPYDADPEASLQLLRSEVFARGDFRRGTGIDPQMAKRFAKAFQSGTDDDLDMFERELFTSLRDSVQTAPWYLRPFVKRALVKEILSAGDSPPDSGASIQSVVEMAGVRGTHSVLDIERVAAVRGFGVATRVPDRTLRHYFGHEFPTRVHVDGKAVEIADDLERWECLFFPVYPIDEGLDQPTEWAFIGVSGD